MNSYEESFATWDKVAARYEEKFMDMTFYDKTYDFICQSIPKPHAQLLEIGCGPGNITRYLLTKRPDFSIFGIDISPNMIALAQKNNPTARFTVMDGRDIHQISAKFDGIIGGFCLPFFSASDTNKLLNDCSILLNTAGFVYFSFVEGLPSQSGFQSNNSGDRIYFNYHSLAQLRKFLQKHGFEEVEIFRIPYPKSATETEIHTILTAKKTTKLIVER